MNTTQINGWLWNKNHTERLEYFPMNNFEPVMEDPVYDILIISAL
jgi:hypothetical protein